MDKNKRQVQAKTTKKKLKNQKKRLDAEEIIIITLQWYACTIQQYVYSYFPLATVVGLMQCPAL